jgi:hypothetical protein
MARYNVSVYTKGGSKSNEEVRASSSQEASKIAKARYPSSYSVGGAQRINEKKEKS